LKLTRKKTKHKAGMNSKAHGVYLMKKQLDGTIL